MAAHVARIFQGERHDQAGSASRPGRHDHRRQRVRRLGRPRPVHRRRDRRDRRAQPSRPAGGRGHQPGRCRPRPLRHRGRPAGTQAHDRGAGARGGAHVDLWLFCPYHPDGSVEAFARASADRKPGPGMALAAAEALDLDLSASWVVGDSAATSDSPGPSGRSRSTSAPRPTRDPTSTRSRILAAPSGTSSHDDTGTHPPSTAVVPGAPIPRRRASSAAPTQPSSPAHSRSVDLARIAARPTS